ncbi:uncharacterized protein BJ171DRAFT_405830, partial [Polychytrium aggregatum]|uniref:uncharacterized protein n=1 Tax=Polychytrium aggregatum TaxID=110093 RepID=UPI0022FDD57F
YVGNLDPRVNELLIQQIFSTAGEVVNVKIIHDRAQYQNGGFNYGFVEFLDHRAAESALQNLNGRKIFSSEIRVNWAFTGSGSSNQKEDTASHAHIFVGDLSAEVNDAVLAKAFSAFGSMSDARVMWDLNSGKSRGYGFVSFREKSDAEQAIAQMNGEWLGSRPIRVNWANQRTTNPAPTANILTGPSLSYEATLSQASSFNTTVYVGNLAPNTTQQDLAALFQRFGFLVEVRVQADRGYGFVKLDTHENAAMAIVSMQGAGLHGRALKCSWGKDRNADASAAAGYYPQFTMPVQQGYGYGY